MLLCCTLAAENRQAERYRKRKQNQLSRSLCSLGSLTVFAPFTPTPPSSKGRWDSIPRSLTPGLLSCCSSCYSEIRKEIWHGDTPRLGCQEKYQLWGRSIYESMFIIIVVLPICFVMQSHRKTCGPHLSCKTHLGWIRSSFSTSLLHSGFRSSFFTWWSWPALDILQA